MMAGYSLDTWFLIVVGLVAAVRLTENIGYAIRTIADARRMEAESYRAESRPQEKPYEPETNTEH